MRAQYRIDVDVSRSLVKIWLGGFFTAADVPSFIAERDAAHRKLKCAPNAHVTMTDVREMNIQPQDTVNAFRNLLSDKRHQSRKVAFVVASSLARMQLIRAAEGRVARLFGSPEEAEEWLFSSDDVEPLAQNVASLTISH